MATSKQALSDKAGPKTPQIIGEDEKQSFDQAIHKRVSERAYLLYESSGREDGNQDSHWLQAENEVLQRGLEIRESGSWLSVNASLPDVSADDVQVYLEPNRIIVRAEKSQAMQNAESQERGLTAQEVFLMSDLESAVDPSTASAAFKDQRLTLMVKKRYPANAGGPTPNTSATPATAPTSTPRVSSSSAKT
jgi:HSP20 family molecular chaperone IbpA